MPPPPRHLWPITTGPHPIWSGKGARRCGQRWNPPGLPDIYTGTNFAISLLEILVRANRKTPPSAVRSIEAQLPSDIPRETFNPAHHPGWHNPYDLTIARRPDLSWTGQQRPA